jgi:hypothetical protein
MPRALRFYPTVLRTYEFDVVTQPSDILVRRSKFLVNEFPSADLRIYQVDPHAYLVTGSFGEFIVETTGCIADRRKDNAAAGAFASVARMVHW